MHTFRMVSISECREVPMKTLILPFNPATKKGAGKARAVLIGLIVLAAVAAGLWFWLNAGGPTDPDARVEGRVYPLDAGVDGRVAQVLVQENQAVQAGDPLVLLDEGYLNARLAETRLALEALRAGLSPAAADPGGRSSATAEEAIRARMQAAREQENAARRDVEQLSVEHARLQLEARRLDALSGPGTPSLDRVNRARLAELTAREALEEALRARFEGITWVSARLSGTRLYIHIKENEVPLSFPEQSHTPCDLRASSDGVITSVVVRSGLPMVKAGDTVTAGQLLVTGCIPITDDSGSVAEARYVHADADVKAVCARSEAEEIPVWHMVKPETGRRRKGLCVVLGNGKNGAHFVWLFPNIWKTDWKTVTSYRKARIFGDFYLPVHVGFIDSAEISPHEEKYTQEQLLALADAYKNRLTENLMEKGVHIIENNVKILVNGSVCRFEAELLTEEAIAVEADPAMDE